MWPQSLMFIDETPLRHRSRVANELMNLELDGPTTLTVQAHNDGRIRRHGHGYRLPPELYQPA
jgi:hypothetical protein